MINVNDSPNSGATTNSRVYARAFARWFVQVGWAMHLCKIVETTASPVRKNVLEYLTTFSSSEPGVVILIAKLIIALGNV